MKKLVNISINRRVTIAMFAIAILLFGFVSFTRLKMNLLPELSYPTITVRTEYEGAAPLEIENLISRPIEEALGVVKNIKKITSISRSGQSDVILEFIWGTDMDFAIMDVREKLDILQLPLDVKKPAILRFDPSMDPIMRFAFFSNKKSESEFDEEELKEIRRFADEFIKKKFETAIGIAAVKVSGGLEDEIQVLIDQEKLKQLKIPIEQLTELIRGENVNLSGGKLKEGKREYLVRTLNQFQSIKELSNLVITYLGEKPILLNDVAKVQHGYKERESISRIKGQEAVEIAIYKNGDANTVSAAKEVKKLVSTVKKRLPKDYKLTVLYDQSLFINQAVNEVLNAGILGGLLAIFILYFFLRQIWTTLIISLSIPVSVIATFNLMYGMNLTLNIMSLGGIALGIGMLLDNSIVVLENISRLKENGMDNVNAAREGTREVSGAVTASTLTTIAVFFPLVFVKGIAGQLFKDQALTITFSLIISLLVALTLIPMLASTRVKKTKESAEEKGEKKSGIRQVIEGLITGILGFFLKILQLISKAFRLILSPFLYIFNKLYVSISTIYPQFLKWSLSNKFMVVVFSLILLIITAYMATTLELELIPQLAQGEFKTEIKLPPGSTIYKTDSVLTNIQMKVSQNKNIKTIFSNAGVGNRLNANPTYSGENWGELSITVFKSGGRDSENEVMKNTREILSDIPAIDYKLYRPTLFSFKTPVEIEIAGYDLTKLKAVTLDIIRQMRKNIRFVDVKSSMEQGHPQIQIRFDRERTAALGLNAYEIGQKIVSKVKGDVASKYSLEDRKINILVRSNLEDRNSIEDIKNIIVNPQDIHPITLQNVADIWVGSGASEIRRIDQERVSLISANLNFGGLKEAEKDLQEIIQNTIIPQNMVVNISGQSEEMATSFTSLKFALLLAIFLVYMVMASQFESFFQPFIIIFSIPLAFIGGVLALWITGSKVSIVVFIGAILLAGIVVNNAIVLIDKINQLIRKEDYSIKDAIIKAGNTRLRPILMTMLTTALGLLPLAIGLGEGAEIRAPMAITVIGGLLVSTLLTLIVVPVIYLSFVREK